MSQNQQVKQRKEIEAFKKSFREKHGVTLYVFTPSEERYRIPLDEYIRVTIAAIHENNPEFKYIKKIPGTKLRKRDYVKWIQTMCYIAWQDGHTKTSIGRAIGKNHATVINSCRTLENAFFACDREMMETFDKLMAKLIEYVGTVPANLEEKNDSKPIIDPIWDQARSFIAQG